MNPLLTQFLSEAGDALEEIGVKLMALEQNPSDKELMTALFRLVHTLKGNSGLFDFPEMSRVLHAGEDLMDAVRHGELPFTRELADCLLDAMDYVGTMCSGLAAGQGLSVDAAAADLQVRRLRQFRAGNPVAELSGAAGSANEGEFASLDPAWLKRLPSAAYQQGLEMLATGATLTWVHFEPSADCFYQGQDPLHLASQTPALLWGGIGVPQAWPALEQLDAFSSQLHYDVVSSAPYAELALHYRYVSEDIQCYRWADGTTTQLALTSPALQALLEAQRAVLAQSGDVEWQAGRLRSVVSTLTSCLLAGGRSHLQASLDTAAEAALVASSGQPLLEWMARVFSVSPPAVDVDLPAPVTLGTGSERDASAVVRQTEDGAVHKTLRVDESKIDRLMNLIGEMVVAKNAIPYLAERAEAVYGLRELGREIKSQYAVINRISEEMQDAIMQVRMLPVSFVFQRFPRLVRDLSQRLGKQVRLVVEGEETAADKNIIEALGDPLVHIVRNCLDHGLETPEQRAVAGKSEQGTLRIIASQQSDRVLIEISDDGRGIDPEVIKHKALEKGLIDPAAAERMTAQEAVNLVFAAGFSTAETVSDLSGRGVGMDVVRNAVERVSGSIALESVVGKGTCIRLSLPLSMAVTHVMTVESNGQMFGVPMDMVVETVRLPAQAVRHIKSSMTAVLRERVIPLRTLNNWLGIAAEPQRNADDELAVLVVRNGEEQMGILIDQFHGTTDIILKPLPGILGQLPAYAGSALLGDGTVLMVLNLREMML